MTMYRLAMLLIVLWIITLAIEAPRAIRGYRRIFGSHIMRRKCRRAIREYRSPIVMPTSTIRLLDPKPYDWSKDGA